MELNPGDIIDTGYEIIRPLGKGGMASVYLAKQDGIFYAIKRLDFSSKEEKSLAVDTFQREIVFLKDIKHPGLPIYYKSFRHRDFFHIVLEYIEGESLENIILNRTEPFSEKKVLEWAIQLCDILFYLHTLSPEPVIYRDLKPGNIIITKEDVIRLIDFGVARRYDPNKDQDTIRLGTPGYAAPEQCRAGGQTTPRTDIYSLGVLLHQLLTLHDPSITPFRLPPIRSLNPEVSEQLEWIINKASSLDSRDRYIDTGLFREELLDYYKEKFGFFTSPYDKQLPYMKESKRSFVTGKIYMIVAYAGAFAAFIANLSLHTKILILYIIFALILLYFHPLLAISLSMVVLILVSLISKILSL